MTVHPARVNIFRQITGGFSLRQSWFDPRTSGMPATYYDAALSGQGDYLMVGNWGVLLVFFKDSQYLNYHQIR